MGNFVSIAGGSGFDPENANLVNLAITGGLNLQGSWGNPGQVVTSNGELNIYWSDSASANGVTSAQLAANLLNYELIANLSGDVVKLTANNTSFVGIVSAANVVSNAQLTANLANYYLASNPSGYISSIPGTYVNTAQLSANLANYTNTAGLAAVVVTVTANNTLFVGTTSAANVVSNTQLSANLANYITLAGLSVNVATLTANNATNFGGNPVAFYANVTSPTFSSNISVGANTFINTTTFFQGNSTVFGIGNSTVDSIVSPLSNVTINSTAITFGNTTVNAIINSTFFTATTNNTSFVGTTSAANVVSNAQLSANLANYTNTAGLPAVITVNTANNTLFVGTTSAANVVSNSQLIANLANFTNTASLVTLAYVNTAQLTANLANYTNTAGLGVIVVTVTANNTLFVGTTSAANVVSNSQLIANLANYQTAAGLAANVAVLTSNNSTNFAGQAQGYYANITNPNFTTSINVATFQVNSTQITIGNRAISANGSLGTAGWVLTTSGANDYWAPVSITTPGSTTQVIFNDGGAVNASAGFVYSKSTNTISIGNSTIFSTINSTSFSGQANNAIALKTDQQTGTNTTLMVTPAHMQDHDGVAKAFVCFSSNTTVVNVHSSYNVTSVVRTGVGAFTITFTTPFAAAFYTAAFSTQNYVLQLGALSASSVNIQNFGSSAAVVDPTGVLTATFFGRQ